MFCGQALLAGGRRVELDELDAGVVEVAELRRQLAVEQRRDPALVAAKPDSSTNQSIQARAAALCSELHVDRELVVAADRPSGTCRRPGPGTACSRCRPGSPALGAACICEIAHEPSGIVAILPVPSSSLDVLPVGGGRVLLGQPALDDVVEQGVDRRRGRCPRPTARRRGRARCASGSSRDRRRGCPPTGSAASRPCSSCTAGSRRSCP